MATSTPWVSAVREWQLSSWGLALLCLGPDGLSCLLVDTCTSARTSVCLPGQGDWLDGRTLSTWSSAGYLAVQHTASKGRGWVGLSTFNAAGQELTTAEVPCLPGWRGFLMSLSWAPDGSAAAFHARGKSCLYVWTVGQAEPVLLQLGSFQEMELAWSFDSTTLLVTGDQSEHVLLLLHRAEPQLLALGSRVWHPVWGSHGRIALQSRALAEPATGDWRKQLRSFRAASHSCAQETAGLQPAASLQLHDGGLLHDPKAALAPDGFCVALPTLTRNKGLTATHGIAIVDLAGRWQLSCKLQIEPARLQWAADGASLLLTDRMGTHYVLLDFSV